MAENLDIRVTESGVPAVRKSIATIGDEADKSEAKVGLLKRALNGFSAGAGIGAAAGVFASLTTAITNSIGAATSGAIKYADSFTSIQNQIKRVSTSSTDLAAKTREVFDISQRTRTSFEANAGTYVKLTQALQTLNMDTAKAGPLLQTIGNAITSSGTSADSAKNGLMQFQQALGTGALRGDEFNSVMENTPGLAAAIAVGIGKPIGALRGMAEQGLLTSKVVIDALGRVGPQAAASMANVAPTFSSAVQMLTNSITYHFGAAATGPVAVLTQGIMGLANNFGTILPFVAAFGAALAVVIGIQLTVWLAGAVAGLTVIAAQFVVAAAKAAIAALSFAAANLPLIAMAAAALGTVAAVLALTIGFDKAIEKAKEFGNSIVKSTEEMIAGGKKADTLDEVMRKMGGGMGEAAKKSTDLAEEIRKQQPAFQAAAAGASSYSGSLDALISKMAATSAQAAALKNSLAGLSEAAASAAMAGVQAGGGFGYDDSELPGVGSSASQRGGGGGSSGGGGGSSLDGVTLTGVTSVGAIETSYGVALRKFQEIQSDFSKDQRAFSTAKGQLQSGRMSPDEFIRAFERSPNALSQNADDQYFPGINRDMADFREEIANFISTLKNKESAVVSAVNDNGLSIVGALGEPLKTNCDSGPLSGNRTGMFDAFGSAMGPAVSTAIQPLASAITNNRPPSMMPTVPELSGGFGMNSIPGGGAYGSTIWTGGGENQLGGMPGPGAFAQRNDQLARGASSTTQAPVPETEQATSRPSRRIEVNFNVKDMDSFRRNKKQVSQDLARTLAKAG